MSELMNISSKNFQWQLLSTVSVLALLGVVCGAGETKAADDGDHPTVWIELGGQLSRLEDGQEAFAPPPMAARPSEFSPSQKFEKLQLYGADEAGKISIQPDSSNWIFSASVLYGRSSSAKHVRQQTNPKPVIQHYTSYSGAVLHTKTQFPNAARFADTSVQNGESHAILDFQAGKDVGLGMFGGKDRSSVFSLGVRFAQFSSNSNIALKSDPDFRRYYKYVNFPSHDVNNEKVVHGSAYHSNVAGIRAARSFHGVGPSLSWNASAPFMGNGRDSELTFDWGLNAAVLFGRQRAKMHHQTTGRYHGANSGIGAHVTVYHPTPIDLTRARTVTVPNVGGFAGLSFRYANAKVSFGYRGDFFFGAIDGGIDARKSETLGFYGPFASVSIGLGG